MKSASEFSATPSQRKARIPHPQLTISHLTRSDESRGRQGAFSATPLGTTTTGFRVASAIGTRQSCVTGLPAKGTLSGNAPNLTFKPVAGGGTVALTYVVSDGYTVSKTGYVYIAFNDAGNPPPVISLASPANNATFAAGSTIVVSANASDADGIQRVDFIAGGSYLGSAMSAPYTINWSNVPAGTYQVVARCYDNTGQRTFSQPIVVNVQ